MPGYAATATSRYSIITKHMTAYTPSLLPRTGIFIGLPNSGNRYGDSRCRPDRLLIALVERVAEGGLDEPTKLAVC